ncbi:MFS general substrate transporter [Flagelloscypha sp. PMI_526]|nr:MFS general substrate transporter [Flagelloscypha sp. PMI_526]
MSNAGIIEKGKEKAYDGSDSGSEHSSGLGSIYQRPVGFRGVYSHPITQVCLMGFVCFMCPGLFNALNGLGGGGQFDASTSANSNTAVYATFAVTAFFAGSVNNKLGSKMTLQLGTLGYALYIASFLVFELQGSHTSPFAIAAGAMLGVCAGLLWTAQGSMMLSYPTEQQKGRFIGIFWSIFNLGGVIGAAVAAGLNWNATAGKVGWGTYTAFLVLTSIGAILPVFMLNPADIVRTDGTKIIAPRHPSWSVELKNLYVALATDPMILLLFPMFFTSNWFYTWQFDDFNGSIFTIRARGLNNVIYWMCQIFGSLSIGILLDSPRLTRRARAFLGWIILLIMVMAVHAWAYHYQRGYTRASVLDESTKFDIYSPGYVERLWLYIFCAFLDSMWQTTTYWMMGAMSNDPSKLAHFTGFCKLRSLLSWFAGAAGAWRADAVKIPFMNLFLSTWGLLVAGLVFSLPMIHLRVKNFTPLADEILVRMDDEGHIRPTEELQRETRTRQ